MADDKSKKGSPPTRDEIDEQAIASCGPTPDEIENPKSQYDKDKSKPKASAPRQAVDEAERGD